MRSEFFWVAGYLHVTKTMRGVLNMGPQYTHCFLGGQHPMTMGWEVIEPLDAIESANSRMRPLARS